MSIIVCAFPYKVPTIEHNISRYAIVKDYHIVVKNLLTPVVDELQKVFPDNKFAYFSDNSPIPEVKAAALAGIGVVGANGLLITEEFGSWVFIGEIVTDLNILHVKNEIKTCPMCGRCKNLCPSGSICDYGVKRESCLSNVSQKKGTLSEREKELIKDNKIIWGCDICQEVCPLNFDKPYTYIKQFLDDVVPEIKFGDYEVLTDRAFNWRPQEVIERNLKLNLHV